MQTDYLVAISSLLCFLPFAALGCSSGQSPNANLEGPVVVEENRIDRKAPEISKKAPVSDKARVVVAPSHSPEVQALADLDFAAVPYENECVVIDGVVYPSDRTAQEGKDNTYEMDYFKFAAWRRPGGPLVRRKLQLMRRVPLRDDLSAFPSYSVHRVRVLLSVDASRAVLEKPLPLDKPDEELSAIGRELRKPVVVATTTFADLILDRDLDCFEGKSKWKGVHIRVTFWPEKESENITKALNTAESLWADQPRWQQLVERKVIEKLLPLKNDSWLKEDESPLTQADFLKRLRLESISIRADGSFEFWHDDGDLFWGHSIEVRGNLKDGITDADIAG